MVERREDWLDWLRAIAILMVLGSHYQIDWRDAGIFLPWSALNFRVGWSGVDLFFVLSGFLIGGLLISAKDRFGRINFRSFYVRRILKIWPLLYLVPVVYIFYAVLVKDIGLGTAARSVIPDFLHVQNYVWQPLGHLWSLAVEEHFYLILPLIVAAIPLSRLPWFVSTSIVLVSVIRIISVLILNLDPAQLRGETHFRIDALFFGVLLALVFRFHRPLWDRLAEHRSFAALGLLLLVWPFAFNPNHSVLLAGPGLTSIFLGYGIFLIIAQRFFSRASVQVRNSVWLASLAWIGRYSYPIYLFHPFVWYGYNYFGIGSQSPPPKLLGSASLTWIVGYMLFLGLAIGIGALMGKLVERPLLALRNRIIPAKVQALPMGTLSSPSQTPDSIHIPIAEAAPDG